LCFPAVGRFRVSAVPAADFGTVAALALDAFALAALVAAGWAVGLREDAVDAGDLPDFFAPRFRLSVVMTPRAWVAPNAGLIAGTSAAQDAPRTCRWTGAPC